MLPINMLRQGFWLHSMKYDAWHCLGVLMGSSAHMFCGLL